MSAIQKVVLAYFGGGLDTSGRFMVRHERFLWERAPTENQPSVLLRYSHKSSMTHEPHFGLRATHV